MLDTLRVHQCDEVPTRKIAAFSYFYDRAVDAGILQKGESAVVQVIIYFNIIKCENQSNLFKLFSIYVALYIFFFFFFTYIDHESFSVENVESKTYESPDPSWTNENIEN